ncbi:MAG: COQ9 family protein [Alphaproteobacteria bacterium]|jgi:ubiquinone biosynthesis protein COQ9|nr:COQ9 family protein [Alphaproteobacteria bacterium]
MTPPSQTIRTVWLEALLPRVPDLGWSESAARAAAREAGISEEDQALAAPGGVADLREAFFDSAEQAMMADMAAREVSPLKMHERVALGVRIWLDTLAPHREAVARATSHAFLPWQTGDAAQRAWSVADAVWQAAGDTAEDYNRYTKRGLLASVIPSIVFYWQGEPDSDALDDFIMRRLKNAMTLGKTGGQVLGPVLRLFETGPGRSA